MLRWQINIISLFFYVEVLDTLDLGIFDQLDPEPSLFAGGFGSNFNPIRTGEGGWNPNPTVFCPLTQKIFRRPIPGTS